MHINYAWLLIVALLVGCAGVPSKVDTTSPPQQVTVSQDEPDMSAVIAALNDGKPVVAEALLRGLTQRHPQAAMPWVNIGLIVFRRGEWDRAQQAAEKALALQPEIAEADYLLGLVAHKKNNAPQALKHYLAALEKNQQHANSHFNLALIYDTYYQDLEKAVHHYRRYLDLTNGDDEETLTWVQALEAQLAPDGGGDEG